MKIENNFDESNRKILESEITYKNFKFRIFRVRSSINIPEEYGVAISHKYMKGEAMISLSDIGNFISYSQAEGFVKDFINDELK